MFSSLGQASIQVQKRGLTKLAPDAGDSAAFSSIFLASGFFCSRSESRPAHAQITQTVRWLLAEQIRWLTLGALRYKIKA
jgi:hypothetical protein